MWEIAPPRECPVKSILEMLGIDFRLAAISAAILLSICSATRKKPVCHRYLPSKSFDCQGYLHHVSIYLPAYGFEVDNSHRAKHLPGRLCLVLQLQVCPFLEFLSHRWSKPYCHLTQRTLSSWGNFADRPFWKRWRLLEWERDDIETWWEVQKNAMKEWSILTGSILHINLVKACSKDTLPISSDTTPLQARYQFLHREGFGQYAV